MAKQYRVADLYRDHGESLQLELDGPDDGMARVIRVPEAQRPGLGLSGYLRGYARRRMLIFGRVELHYLRDLKTEEQRESRLASILTKETPAVMVARRYRPPAALIRGCRHVGMPLFRSEMKTADLISKINILLNNAFAPSETRHGCLVEVYGVGVMIEGDSSVGKSEAAVGLIERGHRRFKGWRFAKVETPQAKRVCKEYLLSGRLACQLVGVHRSLVRYEGRVRDDTVRADMIREMARKDRPLWLPPYHEYAMQRGAVCESYACLPNVTNRL